MPPQMPPPEDDPFKPPSEKPPLAPPFTKPPAPLQEQISGLDTETMSNTELESKPKKKRSKRDKSPLNPEVVARKRTSESVMKLVAGLAIQFAIRSRNPEAQNQKVREAEHGYLNRLWNSYTKRALRIGR